MKKIMYYVTHTYTLTLMLHLFYMHHSCEYRLSCLYNIFGSTRHYAIYLCEPQHSRTSAV